MYCRQLNVIIVYMRNKLLNLSLFVFNSYICFRIEPTGFLVFVIQLRGHIGAGTINNKAIASLEQINFCTRFQSNKQITKC